MLMALEGCGQVTIKDFEACQDLAEYGAHCNHFLSPAARDLSKIEWDKERFGQFCVNYTVIGELKAEIEKLCNAGKKCTYEQKKQLAHVTRMLRDFEVTAVGRRILAPENFEVPFNATKL